MCTDKDAEEQTVNRNSVVELVEHIKELGRIIEHHQDTEARMKSEIILLTNKLKTVLDQK